MSATISQKDALHIQDSMALKDVQLIRHSQCIRPELTYEVWKKNKNETMDQLQRIIADTNNGRCIIYCATPDKCIRIYEGLSKYINQSELGIYHGKLPENERDTTLDKWQNGVCRTMIATSSFGMGIHAPNVRRVVHYVFPLSMSK
jgi:ATP-dependent DNA helicase RecQ